MNERIRELAKQTGLNSSAYIWHASGDPQVYEFTPEKLQKFAELIVRECMGLCYRIDTEYEGKKVKPTVIASKVAEHFGVKE